MSHRAQVGPTSTAAFAVGVGAEAAELQPDVAFAFPTRDPNQSFAALVTMIKQANDENSCVLYCCARV